MSGRDTTDQIGMYKTASVKKHTAKSWDEWIAILDKSGARNLDHGEIAALLTKKYKLTPWWRHAVAWGYEVHIGRKVEGRNAKGRWSLTATKSLHHSATTVWKFVLSPEGQSVWLKPMDTIEIEPKATFETEDGFYGEVRTMRADRHVRLSWKDPEWDRPSYVQLFLVKRAGEKSLLAFGHGELPDSRSRDQMRARWKGVLEDVVGALETAPAKKSRTKIKAKASGRTRPRSG